MTAVAEVDATSLAGTKVGIVGVSTPARRRLLDHEVDLTDDFAPECQLVLMATRGTSAHHHLIDPYLEADIPVVVVAHPGGEQDAAALVARGATTVVAEGREATALDLLRDKTTDRLVRSYQLYLDGGVDGAGAKSIDPVTKLPTQAKFDRTLATVTADGSVPRLGFLELGPPDVVNRLAAATFIGIRRRFATVAAEFVSHVDGSMFDLGNRRLAFIIPELDHIKTGWLCHELIVLARSFSSKENELTVWIGTAGPESAVDGDSLIAMTSRSLDAAHKREAGYIDGDELSKDASDSVELDSALAASAAVDAQDPRGSHSERVANLAEELAVALGFEDFDIAKITLAARLHDIGKLRFGAAAFDESQDQHEACKTEHPAVGAAYVNLISGEEVAGMVRGHHEQWDGSGYPNRLAENDIPVGARIIAIADHYDQLMSDGKSESEITDALQSGAGKMFDPHLIATFLETL